MSDDVWVIVKTPAGVWAWHLGDVTDDERADLIDAARASVGFPANDNWPLEAGYDLQVTFYEPHPTLLAQATVGGDLRKVPRKKVDAHKAARAEWQRTFRVESMLNLLRQLDADELDELKSRL
jgi:hypothetical protein